MKAFGFITDAFDEESALRARLLARSLRRHDPQVPIGLIAWCPLSRPSPEFDVTVDAHRADPYQGRYRTFNKLVGVGWHSPFERGLFLDNDTIVVAPLRELIERHCSGLPFALNMSRVSPDSPHAGLNHVDPRAVADAFGLDQVYDPDGGGHLYFEIPACRPFFREALDLAVLQPELYSSLVGNGFLSEEVALAFVANRHGLDMPVLGNLVQCILPTFAECLDIDPVTWLAHDVGKGAERWAAERRIVHFCAHGKKCGPYSHLARTALGTNYPLPPPSRLSSLLSRAALWLR